MQHGFELATSRFPVEYAKPLHHSNCFNKLKTLCVLMHSYWRVYVAERIIIRNLLITDQWLYIIRNSHFRCKFILFTIFCWKIVIIHPVLFSEFKLHLNNNENIILCEITKHFVTRISLKDSILSGPCYRETILYMQYKKVVILLCFVGFFSIGITILRMY